MNRLANTYLEVKAGHVDYPPLVDAIVATWKDVWGEPLPTNQSLPGISHPIDRLISVAACVTIQALLNDHKAGRARNEETNITFFKEFFGYQHQNQIPPGLIERWQTARKWFVKHAHLADRDFDSTMDTLIREHFATLEESLLVAATTATESLTELNEILDNTNS